MDKAVILGAGTYGRVYAEYIKDQSIFEIVGFLDDDRDKIGKTFNGIDVLGPIGSFETIQDKNINNVFCTNR